MDVSPGGAAIATGSSDKTARLWDLNMRAAVQTMSNHANQVWGMAFRPPGKAGVRAGRLASVSNDRSISFVNNLGHLEFCLLRNSSFTLLNSLLLSLLFLFKLLCNGEREEVEAYCFVFHS